MKLKQITFVLLTVSFAVFTSCKKEDSTPETETSSSGEVEVNLEHKWGTLSSNFDLNTNLIHPVTNDTMNFTTMKYYISNLKLKKEDGTWWTHPESYFLVDVSDPSSSKMVMKNVPAGIYTAMEYTFGVDSLRNVSGAQTGALAIANGMFWTWNSGYIFLKAEGISPNSSTDSYSFHLGGFKGLNNVLKTSEFVFNSNSVDVVVSKGHTSEIHLNVFPDKLWNTVGSVSGTNTIHTPGADAKTMANDFAAGILFDHVHN